MMLKRRGFVIFLFGLTSVCLFVLFSENYFGTLNRRVSELTKLSVFKRRIQTWTREQVSVNAPEQHTEIQAKTNAKPFEQRHEAEKPFKTERRRKAEKPINPEGRTTLAEKPIEPEGHRNAEKRIQSEGRTKAEKPIEPEGHRNAEKRIQSEGRTKAEKPIEPEGHRKAEKRIQSEGRTKAEKPIEPEGHRKAEKRIQSEERTKAGNPIKAEERGKGDNNDIPKVDETIKDVTPPVGKAKSVENHIKKEDHNNLITKQVNKIKNVQEKSETNSHNIACPKEGRDHVKKDVFQPIAGSTSYVFSAYLDNDMIRVFLVLNETEGGHFTCHFWAGDGYKGKKTFIEKVPGKLKIHHEFHQKEYELAFVFCKPPKGSVAVPNLMLAITHDKCPQPSNMLQIHDPGRISSDFTLCVAPIHGHYDKRFDLVEMIELNILLGANKFYFYNSSTSRGVDKVLEYYKKIGLVEVIQWHLPLTAKNEIISMHYMGQEVAMNDCLYRNRNRTHYVVFTDIDEFIVPRGHFTTWSQLIKHRLNTKPTASNFMARNIFFRKDWKLQNNSFSNIDTARHYHSIVLEHVQREEEAEVHGKRSKVIANPRLVTSMSVHTTRERPKNSTDYLPLSEAILHHYRRRGHSSLPAKRVLDDRVVKKYGIHLVHALKKRWTEIGLD